MTRRLSTATLATALLACTATESRAQFPRNSDETRPLKEFVDRNVVNEIPQFFVRVEVNNPDHVYYKGEELKIRMKAEKTCYLHVININKDGKPFCLFPNVQERENKLEAGSEMELRGFEPGGTYGNELICVLATETPQELFPGRNLLAGPSRATPLEAKDIESLERRVPTKGGKLKEFVPKPRVVVVEHRINVRTVPTPRPGGPQQQVDPIQQQGQRWAICIGISDYQDPDIPDLRLSENDARQMAQTLKDYCGVSQVQLLAGRDATLAAIRQAIFEDMKTKSRPGDTIIIYFSGHGGKCADTDGDESVANGGDGMDEYLVPYDGVLARPEETMLVDDTFGRWLNELQGRKVLVILDNCYSGGQAKGMKGRLGDQALRPKGVKALPAQDLGQRPGLGLKGVISSRRLEGFQDEVNRIDRLRFRSKDIGGAVVLLAASEASQIAFEMPNDEGSVLTYYLTKALRSAPSRYTPEAAYNQIKKDVEDYVQQAFQTTQTPVLTGNSPGLLIRP